MRPILESRSTQTSPASIPDPADIQYGRAMTLIAEDLLLLLLDDEGGTLPSGLAVKEVLGGAVLVELAMLEAVEVRKAGSWGRSKVYATGRAAPEDPELRDALARVEEKDRTAQDLVGRLGRGLKERLTDRLAERGILERRDGRVLGVFPHTTWPAADTAHEGEVRRALTAALVQGFTPDDRTAALIALLHAVDRAHKTVDSQGLGSRAVKKRAKEIAEGDWAAKAVRDAVQASQAAMVAVIAGGAAAAGSS